MSFNITNYIKIFSGPVTIIDDSFWNEHLPFAFFLIEVLRPSKYVELGVFRGASYNTFCQAVKELKTDTKCYGIDNWEGDIHHGNYDDSIYRNLVEYQHRNYSGFSRLLKMPFDDALSNFPDGSIDLLHIDGCHLYEAVKHDYESWLPKMSEQGVMIFHDTCVREQNFGVWQLWEEISAQYPSFEFKYGCGLGILAVGRSVKREFLEFLTEAKQSDFYSALFGVLGKTITNEVQLVEKDRTIQQQDQALKQQDIAIQQLNDQMKQILTSKKWQLAVKLSKISQLIAPQGSWRRQLLKWLINKLRIK